MNIEIIAIFTLHGFTAFIESKPWRNHVIFLDIEQSYKQNIGNNIYVKKILKYSIFDDWKYYKMPNFQRRNTIFINGLKILKVCDIVYRWSGKTI
jgi:hypothetical protein